MSFDEGNKYGLYITAIIAIVAIAGMVVLFNSQKAGYIVSQGETPSFVTTTSDTGDNLAGQAYYVSNPAECVRTCYYDLGMSFSQCRQICACPHCNLNS